MLDGLVYVWHSLGKEGQYMKLSLIRRLMVIESKMDIDSWLTWLTRIIAMLMSHLRDSII